MEVVDYLLGKKAGGGSGSNLQTKDVTITQNGITEITPDTGYDGMSKVNATVSGILDTSDANATTDDIPLGKSGYVNGVKVNGSVPIGSSTLTTNYASNNISTYLDDLKVDTEQSVRNQFFYTGDKISVLAPLNDVAPVIGATAEKIKKDEVICGVTGTYEGSGSTEVVEKDVNFYDYDGALLYSYTSQEFLALESMPENPSHDGLTAQGWNWQLAGAKTYVTNHGALDVGQMYITSDGSARIYISLVDGGLSPYIGFGTDGTVTIDWGDGSPTEEHTGSSATVSNIFVQHNYSQAGDYIIKLSCPNDKNIYFGGTRYTTYILNNNNSSSTIYGAVIKKVETSSNTILGQYAFQYATGVEQVLISKGTTINDNFSFSYCSSLRAIVLPDNITAIKSGFYIATTGAQYGTGSSLKCLILPSTITEISNSFQHAPIKSLTIPDSVASLPDYFLCNNIGLKRVVLPNSLTATPNRFCQSCNNLSKIIFGNSLLTISSNAFYYSSAIREINLPDTITTLGGFYYCAAMFKIIMPRDLTQISNFAFRYASAFYWDFSKTTQIPTLEGNDIGVASVNIIVPDNLYDDWIVASRWANYASRIIKASEWEEQNI